MLAKTRVLRTAALLYRSPHQVVLALEEKIRFTREETSERMVREAPHLLGSLQDEFAARWTAAPPVGRAQWPEVQGFQKAALDFMMLGRGRVPPTVMEVAEPLLPAPTPPGTPVHPEPPRQEIDLGRER